MSGEPLLLLVERDPAGGLTVRAPAVGIVTTLPDDGALVGAGSPAGELVQLRRRFRLILPDGAEGRVAGASRADRAIAAGYGDVLFTLAPVAAARSKAPARAARSAASARGAAVVAPTAGVFYRSPSAGAPPYVTPGDRVRRGQPVGLIEVMKTFNPIAYGGAGMPDDAEVVEVLAGDGEEVRAGQPLVVVR